MRNYSQLFKALSDETRLRLLLLLCRRELCVSELVAALELPQSTVSRHLAYLRTSGWVEDRRDKVKVIYRLRKDSGLRKKLLFLLEKELFDLPTIQADLQNLEHPQQSTVPEPPPTGILPDRSYR